MNTKAWMASGTLAGASLAAPAQLFVEQVGEPEPARETTNDLIILGENAEISAVGEITRESMNMASEGYLVLHDPAGVPFLSWFFRDPISASNALLAHRQDPRDGLHMILKESAVLTPPPLTLELDLFKFDPFSGGFAYQWRYPITSFGENLGMEVDGVTTLVAAGIVSPASGTSNATLLRYDNASGLPVFHNAYPVFGSPAFNGRFFDVVVDRELGDIFAVGSIEIDDPDNFRSSRGVLIARFDSTGAPVWFNVYEPVGADIDTILHTGTSITLTPSGDVAVTARMENASGSTSALHMVVSRPGGVPLGATTVRGVNGLPLVAAFSSLETLADGTLLASGTITAPTGAPAPCMWNFKSPSGALNWFYIPESLGLEGTSAIAHPGEGLLLGGEWFAPPGPIGGLNDMLLARTAPSGAGYCDLPPDLSEIPTGINFLSLQVDPVDIPEPEQIDLEADRGDPIGVIVCDCPADFNHNGMTDFPDVGLFIAAWSGGDLAADFNNNGVTDFPDVGLFIAAWSAGCP